MSAAGDGPAREAAAARAPLTVASYTLYHSPNAYLGAVLATIGNDSKSGTGDPGRAERFGE